MSTDLAVIEAELVTTKAELVAAGDELGRLRPSAPPLGASRPLSSGAQRLVMAGIPLNTRVTYQRAWDPYDAWCVDNRLDSLPSAESTMIEYLHHWEGLPVHNRCTGGRQSNGDECGGHRPAPSSMWVWYSAVRFAHSFADPSWPWYGGKRLASAMKGYSDEMVHQLGWKPNKAPRAWPEHVMAMVDTCDPTNPKDVRDKAIVLTNWYTMGRASDLATYRIPDAVLTPVGYDLSLRGSKTNKAVGKKIERRVLRPNPGSGRYCAVAALEAWISLLRNRYGVIDGALFRPFTKPSLKTGIPTLLRGARDSLAYKMASVSVSEIIQERAIMAGVPDGEHFTCHSLRRGRASQLRALRVDSLAIARAGGWVPGGAVNEYLEEAEAFDDEAPANIGLLV